MKKKWYQFWIDACGHCGHALKDCPKCGDLNGVCSNDDCEENSESMSVCCGC